MIYFAIQFNKFRRMGCLGTGGGVQGHFDIPEAE